MALADYYYDDVNDDDNNDDGDAFIGIYRPIDQIKIK